METRINTSIRKKALRAIRDTAIDTSLGTVCGGLYGLIFGGFGALLDAQAYRLVSVAGYFALCGAAAAGLVSIFGWILIGSEKEPDSMHFISDATAKNEVAVDPVRHLMVPSPRQTQNSLTPASNLDGRRTLTAASKHPLSC
jgi:hypothetical protein